MQRAKVVVSDCMRLEDFAIELVNFPNGQVRFLGEFKLQKNNIVILVSG